MNKSEISDRMLDEVILSYQKMIVNGRSYMLHMIKYETIDNLDKLNRELILLGETINLYLTGGKRRRQTKRRKSRKH